MLPRTRIVSILLFAALLLAACSSAGLTPAVMMEAETAQGVPAQSEMMDSTPEAMMEGDSEMPSQDPGDQMAATESSEMMAEEQSTEEMAAGGKEAMMEAPAWFSTTLTDVRSGQDFSIADYKDKVLLVETMAIWCSTCLAQQKQVVALHGLLGERDDFLSIGLDIDPNENAEDLKTYTVRNGFDWVYAISPARVSSEIGSLYGDQFLTPPSAPMFIIDRHGEVHPLPFGVKSAEDLQEALEPFLNEGM
jgi:hypothetical protein